PPHVVQEAARSSEASTRTPRSARVSRPGSRPGTAMLGSMWDHITDSRSPRSARSVSARDMSWMPVNVPTSSSTVSLGRTVGSSSPRSRASSISPVRARAHCRNGSPWSTPDGVSWSTASRTLPRSRALSSSRCPTTNVMSTIS
ncbi:hypothetical protein ALMP_39470, partial [Streptomyces sp. A012304]